MRRVALVVAAVLPLALGACRDSSGPDGAIAGTYRLRSIEGGPVPAVTLARDGFTLVEVTDGVVRLNADGSFSASYSQRATSGNSVIIDTEKITGRFTRSGEAVTLTFPDPDGFGTATLNALWEGDRLMVFVNGNRRWVYER